MILSNFGRHEVTAFSLEVEEAPESTKESCLSSMKEFAEFGTDHIKEGYTPHFRIDFLGKRWRDDAQTR